MSQLTQKQEAFCLAFLEKNNASEAYRLAYGPGRNKPETINRMAFRLMQLPKICARIDELRAQAAKVAILTQASIISDLIRVKDHCMEMDEKGEMLRPEAAVRTLELLGKNLGMWKPDTMIAVQVNEGRESFEKVLERAITIDYGHPDFEDRKRRDIGMLYERWSRGEKIEDNPIIGGLSDPFQIEGGYVIRTEGPLPEGATISGGDGHGFIVAPKQAESMEAWEQIANPQK